MHRPEETSHYRITEVPPSNPEYRPVEPTLITAYSQEIAEVLAQLELSAQLSVKEELAPPGVVNTRDIKKQVITISPISVSKRASVIQALQERGFKVELSDQLAELKVNISVGKLAFFISEVPAQAVYTYVLASK